MAYGAAGGGWAGAGFFPPLLAMGRCGVVSGRGAREPHLQRDAFEAA
jgi:hypothetical protein